MLLDLANEGNLDGFRARLAELSSSEVAKELFEPAENGSNALHNALTWDIPLDLLIQICDLMKGDPLKRNPFAITNTMGWTPLHYAATWSDRDDVVQHLIDRFPHALVRRSRFDVATPESLSLDNMIPLELARYHVDNPLRPNFAAVLRCLEVRTASYPTYLNQQTTKMCLVKLKSQGLTAVVSRAETLNDLTGGEFVFYILDNMKNRMMHALAERIVGFVGVSVGLLYERDGDKAAAIGFRGVDRKIEERADALERRIDDRIEGLEERIGRVEERMKEQDRSRRNEHKAIMDVLAALTPGGKKKAKEEEAEEEEEEKEERNEYSQTKKKPRVSET